MTVNRERGEAILVASSRRYVLRLSVAACVALETEAGQTLDALTAKAQRGQIGAIRWIVWAALQDRHGAEIDRPEQAGAVIDRAGGVGAVAPIVRAFLILNADDSDDRPEPKKGESKGSAWRAVYLALRGGGLAIETIWTLSLKELWRELAVLRQRAKAERDRDLTLAWHCAALVWSKKLPSLDRLLNRSERRQTPAEAKAAVLAISELYGLKIRKRRKAKRRA